MNSKLTDDVRVRITREHRLHLEEIAERDDRSVAAIIRRAVREYLERDRQTEEAVA